VPLTVDTTALLTDYLAEHPRRTDPSAPLFPAIRLTGVRAGVPVTPAHLDWQNPLRHTTFYGRVFAPALANARVLYPNTAPPEGFTFHSLRHTYVSLCVAAGIPPLEISRFAGHSTVTTTLSIYAHLFESDHSAAMGKLGAMGSAPATNVVPLRAVPG
jgi:integrase